MDVRQRILNFLAATNYRPLKRHELAKALKLDDAGRVEFRRALAELLHKGEIVRVRKERFVLPAEADLVIGKLHMNERGYGFVIPELDEAGKPTASADIYIAADDVWVGMHGDRVVVRLRKGSVRPDRRHKPSSQAKLEGRIIRILQRANETLVGTLQKTKLFFYVVPDDPRVINDIYVKPALKVQVGDKVVVKLHPWESRHVNPEGEIIEVLGHGSAPGVDMIAIIRKHRLPQSFPADVTREVERFPDEPTEEDRKGRLDLCNEFIVTIDPDDARDHDDAVSVEERPDGSWRLGVHIADVSNYVRPKTALDREALDRGNSIYLVDRVIPMLPEKLSAGLCSLFGNVDRLAKTAFIEFNRQGATKRVEFHNTVIRVRHLITYKEAFRRLNSADGDELTENLKTQWRLASLLRKNRFAKGSLDLDFPEVKVRLNDQGKPIALEKVENDISHQLIEEFMLAANEAVGRHIKNCSVPGIYRIHENPDPVKLEEFRHFVAGFGLKAGDLTVRAEIQKLLAQVRGHPQEYVLKVSLLRSLKRAIYSPRPIGHYGLAKVNYSHFTSPIRRYPDLVAHRILDALIHRRPTGYSTEQLTDVARHCSETERTADEAESESKKLKTLEYFNDLMMGHRLDVFDALITDVRNYGLFVELPETLIFGLVHVSSIDDDFYAFDDVHRRLVGKRTRRTFKIGDRVKVMVARVDLFKRQVDFQIVKDK